MEVFNNMFFETAVISPASTDEGEMKNFPMIGINDQPSTSYWKLETMYKQGINGQSYFWRVGFDGRNLLTEHGVTGGAIIPSKRIIAINSSGRSLADQALLEARSEYRIKFREGGYRSAGSTTPVFPEPSLGKTYEANGTLDYPVIVEPKLDGIRWLVSRVGNEISNRTRTNKSYPHITHITSQLFSFFEYLPTACETDGELYRHGWSFNHVSSVIRREKNVHQDIEKIIYVIFDIRCPSNPQMSYLERYNLLCSAYLRYKEDHSSVSPISFFIIDASVANSKEEVERKYSEYFSLGFEGLVIRKPGYPYRPGRSDSFLKYKNSIEEEAIIVGITEGVGKEQGLAIPIVRDIRGNIFSVHPRGNHEERANWFINAASLIGKPYTIIYQCLSEYGVPRFPIGKDIRDYE